MDGVSTESFARIISELFFKAILVLVVLFSFSASFIQGGEVDFTKPKIEGHPRLFLTADGEARIKELIATDLRMKQNLEILLLYADRVLTEEPAEYKLIGAGTTLPSAREVLRRSLNLSLAWRLNREENYLRRVLKELEAAAAWTDWDPPGKFLGVAEMTLAFAVAYDWLYEGLSESERKFLAETVQTMGLERGFAAYERGAGWVTAHHNWNQVCNAGMTAGAIAFLERNPDLSEKILNHVVESAPHGMLGFQPEGVCVEGPGYWEYAIQFGALLVDALRQAYGEDFALLDSNGIRRTGHFRRALTGNDLRPYGFSDAAPSLQKLHHSLGALGLGHLNSQPELIAWDADLWQRRVESAKNLKGVASGIPRLFAMRMIWYDPAALSEKIELPLDVKFDGPVPVGVMRGNWDDPGASFLAFKGGKATANHSHLDHGSFEFSADGVKWALDLGGDSYGLPGYFSGWKKDRIKYFRLNTLSHNTVVLNGENQSPEATAKIVQFQSTPKFATAIVDLTDAYECTAVRSLRRGFAFDRRRALIIDELDLTEELESYRWAMVTPATIQLDGARAILSMDGKTLEARILSPEGPQFSELSTAPPTEKENPNTGTSMLAIQLDRLRIGKYQIAVLLSPGDSAKLPVPSVPDMNRWR